MKRLLLIILFAFTWFTAFAIDPEGSRLSDENSGNGSGLIILATVAIAVWILYSAIVGRINRKRNKFKDDVMVPKDKYKTHQDRPSNIYNKATDQKKINRPFYNPSTNVHQTADTYNQQLPKTYQQLVEEIKKSVARKREDGSVYCPKTSRIIKGTLVEKRQHQNDWNGSVDIRYSIDEMGKVGFTHWRFTTYSFPPEVPDDKFELWHSIAFNPEPTSDVDGEYFKRYSWKIRDLYPIYFNFSQ